MSTSRTSHDGAASAVADPGAVATATAPEGDPPAETIEVEEQLDFDRDPANTGTHLPLFWRVVVMALTIAGVVLVLNQVFFWNLGGTNLLTNSFLYYLLAAFLPIVFIICPIRKQPGGATSRTSVPWYDIVLAALILVTAVYFGMNGQRIFERGWDYVAPPTAMVFAFLLWILVLETLRRTAGLIVTGIALVFSLYPVFAAGIPVSFLQGIPFRLDLTAQIHAMGVDSIMGLPLQTAASLLVGFLIFGVALQFSGGAVFFYDLAMSAFGRYRGGSAKVSVVSSAAMGMMSGSAVSNVLTTGPMTIPAMKRSGFPAKYAAGIEATSATGGTITPPIMGTAAFLMVSFVGVPYGQIALAAAIPAFLYFWGIFLQVDAYSAKSGLRGMPKEELPTFGRTVLRGVPYIVALVGLVLLLVVMNSESQAPFWAIGFLLLCMLFMKRFKLTPTSFLNFIYASGKTVAEIIGIIAGVGLIVGGLSMTGVSLSLARELVNLVGDNLALILIAGALTSFVLGMGMTVSAVYVLLAIVMAPALTEMGVNPIAAHLFVIYWATVSYITPPVALASFAAANIARTPPMATSITAMRLGSVKYIIPFAFAVNPALVAQESTLTQILVALGSAMIGIYLLATGFEGYLTLNHRRIGIVIRSVSLAAGLLLLWPATVSTLIGLGLAALTVVLAFLFGTRGPDFTATAVPAATGSHAATSSKKEARV
ncbi:TRAP transporter permease [Brevibacterium jeotgali]|uniref:TRAP transporter, 4TM/12TM fusion protein n=1 Tax=Brevibacterium jeotgali TaxID=1262550 RepID=A0A2H1L3B9_9MICO|nr:TRAP transporter permease [Brevibacterium jeotgali]TWC01652.1 TRAP transporter 4TM/12TM fusion protein [Brevibacterium jeotgali]SMY11397.1 TRAP transporter, 4TM/12TM fusion protein [Brevibacterium jeotgali]